MFMKGGKMSIGGLKKFIESTYDDKTDEIDGYIIDRQLSTMHTKVFYNPNSKILICVERPTSDKRDILSDVIAGLDITGLLFKKIDSRYKNSFKVYKQALLKYNSRNSSILVGYSLGALVAEEMARSNPNSFNEYILVSKPVIPSRVLSKLPKGTTEVRSTLDPVNLLKPLQQKSDRELVIKAETFNPIKEHRIDNIFPRISQDLEVGDENIISGTGNNKFKKYNQYKMDSYEGYGVRKWYTESQIKKMGEKELKSAIKVAEGHIPKKYHNPYNSGIKYKSKEELQETLREISKYLAGDAEPMLKKHLVLEEPIIEGAGIKKFLTEQEMKKLTVKELKKLIVQNRKYADPKYKEFYKVSNKNKNELKEIIRRMNLIPN